MNDFQGMYNVRDVMPGDLSFIMATFLRGLYYGDSWFSEIPKDIFMDNYKRVVKAIVDNPKTIIKVACLPDDPEVILGYSILGDDFKSIHWIYVKSIWRHKGIAKSLLPQFPTRVTHLTSLGKSLMNKYPDTIFNPFLP